MKTSGRSQGFQNMTLVASLVGVPIVFAPLAHALPETQQPDVQAQKDSPSLWDQEYMFGDWGGERSRLAEQGVVFDFNDIGDFLTDVTGSQTHHATYFGRFRASTDLDFNKLAQFDGEFFFSGIYQYGENLSGEFLHVNTLSSSIAGANSLRFDQLWYQQGFFRGLFKLKLGQIAAVNEFGATDFFDILLMTNLVTRPMLSSQRSSRSVPLANQVPSCGPICPP